VALESLHNEVSFLAKHSIDEGREHLNNLEIEHLINDEGREHLNNLEIEHLINMTNDVVMKIKQQTKEML
jgi:uncharacterized membrane protein